MLANGVARLVFVLMLISALTACVRLDTNGYHSRGFKQHPIAPIRCLGKCP